MRLIKEKKIVDQNAKTDPLSVLISSFFYTGFFPKASGTVGSIAALIIFVPDFFRHAASLAVLIVVTFAAGVATSSVMMKRYGDDPSVVVIDEAAGMWLTVLILMLFTGEFPGLQMLGVCFVMFRFFDIVKVQPAKYFDGLNSGFGIMTDDIVAGVYAGIASCLISVLKSKLF